MALSAVTTQPTSATVATAGTSVAPTAPIPDNCHTVIVYNPDATATIFFAEVTSGTINAANGVIVPPGGAFSLALGPLKQRASPGTLRYDSDTNGAVARIVYVNGVAA